jgi:hypothetical protein
VRGRPLLNDTEIVSGVQGQFVRLGRYHRIKPLVFSFVPRSQGLPGRAKKIPSVK